MSYESHGLHFYKCKVWSEYISKVLHAYKSMQVGLYIHKYVLVHCIGRNVKPGWMGTDGRFSFHHWTLGQVEVEEEAVELCETQPTSYFLFIEAEL